MLAMADVSGHGVGAALYMAAAKGALQAEARRAFSPADLLRRTNEALAADFARSDVFATAFFARFHAGGRRMESANGGHNPPVLLRAGGGIELLDRGGAALGVLPDLLFEEEEKDFQPGDLLFVYTDGLTEARDAAGRFYGRDRLVQLLERNRSSDARTIVGVVLEDLETYCGRSSDDVTLIAVRGVSGSPEDATS